MDGTRIQQVTNLCVPESDLVVSLKAKSFLHRHQPTVGTWFGVLILSLQLYTSRQSWLSFLPQIEEDPPQGFSILWRDPLYFYESSSLQVIISV